MGLYIHISWTTVSQVLRQLVQLAAGAILARLLLPEDFGLIALVVVFTGFSAIFADLGFGAALIQSESVTERDLDFVFWLNTGVGCIVTAATCLSAPFVAHFYQHPELVKITLLLSVNPLLGALSLVPSSMLQKQFRFKALALCDMTSVLSSAILGCTCAFCGWGPYSLVVQAISAQAASTILRSVVAGWHPRFRLNWREGVRFIPYGSRLLGSNAINYWLRNGDNLLVGKFCGAAQLGFYSRAYTLMMLPQMQVQAVLSPVLFPTLSTFQKAFDEMRRIFLLATQAIAVFAFPVMLGMVVVADDFVRILWGPHWSASVPIIRMLCIVGVGNSVGTTVGWIYMSVGRTDRMLWWTMFASPFLLLSFLVGVHWGALGVAIAYCVAVYLLWYPQWRFAGSLIDLSFGKAMSNLKWPFIWSILMAVVVIAIRAAIGAHLGPALRLLVTVPAGALVYLAGLESSGVPAYVYLKRRILKLDVRGVSRVTSGI